MPDQDDSLITTPPEDASDAPSQEWLETHSTTAEERASAKWVEGRTQDVGANKVIKQILGPFDYEAYRDQLAALSSAERLSLIDKSPDEIAAHLELRAEAERDQRRREEASEKQAREQAEANFAANETPQLREVRNAMKTAYQDASSLDARIAELQRLNELRDDPSAKGWDKLSAEKWRAAREGTLESVGSEIANLIQEKQAKLQEAALHQNAYHEGTRTIQGRNGYPVPDRPIGQIVGSDGQPTLLTRADITQLLQIERDQQNYAQQVIETAKRHPDWLEAGQSAARAGVDVTAGQAQFIMTLPNGPEIAYHLAKNHADTRALAQMNNHDAARALIRLSHQLASSNRGMSEERKVTSAPKPPSPVSGHSRGDFDLNDDSTSTEEWLSRRHADLKRKGKY